MARFRRFIAGALMISASWQPLNSHAQELPLTPFFGSPQTVSLEEAIRYEAHGFLTSEGPPGTLMNRASITLEPLNPDWNQYNSIVASSPRPAQALFEQYQSRAQHLWYGIIHVQGRPYVGLFNQHQQGQPGFNMMFEPVDASQAAFIRGITNYGNLAKDSILSPTISESRIAQDPFGCFQNIVRQASGPHPYWQHATPETIQRAWQALEHAGPNRHHYLKAMNAMDPLETILSCHLLSFMDSPHYGFASKNHALYPDLNHHDTSTFYENVSAVAAALRTYPWAREQAQRDWNQFISGVLPPRITNEYDCGKRLHLFQATKALLLGVSTLEGAVERIIQAAPKVFRFSNGYGFEDSNWLQYLIVHQDRCEAMAMFGAALLRTAGIPTFYAHTPWWADADNNHAWLMVQYAKPNGDKGFFSFLPGDLTRLPDGKPLLHVNDILNPSYSSFTYKGRAVRGMPGCAKVYIDHHIPGGMGRVDITAQCTTTVNLAFHLGPSFANQSIHLNVFNSGSFRKVQSTTADRNGTAHLDQVGCIPRSYAPPDQAPFGAGLLYTLSSNTGIIDVPFILSPDGTRSPITPYRSQPHQTAPLQGFSPHTPYTLYAFAQTPHQNGFSLIGSFTADAQGTLVLPITEGNLILPIPAGASTARPLLVVHSMNTLYGQAH